MILRAPPVEADGAAPSPPAAAAGRTTLAYQFNAPIYRSPDAQRIAGFARRGQRLAVARWLQGSNCSHGWLELRGGGYVCGDLGFDTSREPEALPDELATIAPSDGALPFTYAKVRDAGTPYFDALPAAGADAAAGSTDGVVFIAVEREHEREDGEVFVEDIRRRFFRRSDLLYKPPPTLRGRAIDAAHPLPVAFVHAEAAPILDPDTHLPVGAATKFARFDVTARDEHFLHTSQGIVPRGLARVARRIDRPDDVGPDAQWIHVDLDRQTLVAYEGDTPVRATLVSSGKPGYEPPAGLFRVNKKYIAKKMAGEDVADGSYDIDQVPYIMYYWGSLALHGAYWHDDFGNVRSHGCTNLAPADARWLFRWAKPKVPRGWLGKVALRGPWVYVTRAGDDAGA